MCTYGPSSEFAAVWTELNFAGMCVNHWFNTNCENSFESNGLRFQILIKLFDLWRIASKQSPIDLNVRHSLTFFFLFTIHSLVFLLLCVFVLFSTVFINSREKEIWNHIHIMEYIAHTCTVHTQQYEYYLFVFYTTNSCACGFYHSISLL